MTLKMIQVSKDTHSKAKSHAKERGMLLSAYIKMLVDKDSNAIAKIRMEKK